MSLSKPKTWRIDTFISGRPVISCVAAVIDPPWPRNARPESVERSGPDSSETLAKDGAPRNRPRRQSNISLFQVANDHPGGNPTGSSGLAGGRADRSRGHAVTACPLNLKTPARYAIFDGQLSAQAASHTA